MEYYSLAGFRGVLFDRYLMKDQKSLRLFSKFIINQIIMCLYLPDRCLMAT